MTTVSTKLTCGNEVPSPPRPSRETRVRDLLKDAYDRKQIGHICRLYPFHDPCTPQNVLTQRWDIELDYVLASRLSSHFPISATGVDQPHGPCPGW
jgi:hypothetical protein